MSSVYHAKKKDVKKKTQGHLIADKLGVADQKAPSPRELSAKLTEGVRLLLRRNFLLNRRLTPSVTPSARHHPRSLPLPALATNMPQAYLLNASRLGEGGFWVPFHHTDKLQFTSQYRKTISPHDANGSDLCTFTSCGRVESTLKLIR